MAQSSYEHIEDLVIQQALNNPNRVAVEDIEHCITYKQLNDLSNCVASNLISYGMTPGQLIPIICAQKSIDIIVVIIGILKAGCVFVPVSAEWPFAMLTQALSEVDSSLIVTDISLNGLVNQCHSKAKIIFTHELIRKSHLKHSYSDKNKHDLAYVIYTSGSTGKPKGVMVSHENLLATQQSWNDLYQLEKGGFRHLQMADVSFDVFIGDWVRALTTGNTLVLCPKKYLLHPEKLFFYIQEKNINFAEFVPVVLRHLTSHLRQTQQTLESIQVLVCGSDNWSIGELREVIHILNKQCRVFNTYGITECTIDSTYFEVNRDLAIDSKDPELVPIGVPLPHVTVTILDQDLQECAVNQKGEICISGLGVSLGYFKQHDLTKERFKNSSTKENISFRTGDFGYKKSDGSIVFLGRNDQQIKIHGKRFDLSALENILKTCPLIDDAAVKVKKSERIGILVVEGYLLLKNKGVTYEALKSYLRNKAPDYAMPRKFYEISTMPLLVNSKINRSALEAVIIREIKPHINSPNCVLEKKLSDIWEEVLQLKIVGVNNTLSELGCSSIESVLLLSKMKEAFGISLSLDDVTDSITIKDVADRIQYNKYSLVEMI